MHGHLRSAGGDHEIDLVADLLDGSVLAFESKLSQTVSAADARHLAALRTVSATPSEPGSSSIQAPRLSASATGYPLCPWARWCEARHRRDRQASKGFWPRLHIKGVQCKL